MSEVAKEEETFSKFSFSKNYNVAPRTLDRNITLLKKHKLIVFKGTPKLGRYKITPKYRKLKVKRNWNFEYRFFI